MMLFLVVTCLLACPVLPMELRGNEDGFGRGTSLARARLGAGWRERPFAAFSAQCSHNTYTTGRQSGCPLRPMLTAHGTDPAAMKTALRLGYRCIEIDVHPRRPSLMGVADEAWVPEAAKPAAVPKEETEVARTPPRAKEMEHATERSRRCPSVCPSSGIRAKNGVQYAVRDRKNSS